MKNFNMIIEHLNYEVERGEKAIEEFLVSFKKDPAYTLSWSVDNFDSTARLDLAKGILANIKDNKDKYTEAELMGHIKDILTNKVMHAARYPERSSSPTGCLMAESRMKALATLLEMFS